MTTSRPIDLPLPDDPMQRYHRFVRDLAWGALHSLWSSQIRGYRDRESGELHLRPSNYAMSDYFEKTWGTPPEVSSLRSLGYLDEVGERVTLTDKAFTLLEDNRPESIFISYRRTVSSAFAMLIAAELRNEGFKPFIDIQDIPLGDKWHSLVEQKVRDSNIFIVVIGPATLNSPYVQAEIEWALENPERHRIIPILHGGFTAGDLVADKYHVLADNNLIPIAPDTAPNFYAALELLKNQLGV